jgi:hypothetical protein
MDRHCNARRLAVDRRSRNHKRLIAIWFGSSGQTPRLGTSGSRLAGMETGPQLVSAVTVQERTVTTDAVPIGPRFRLKLPF